MNTAMNSRVGTLADGHLELDPKVRERRAEWHDPPVVGLTVMANSDVDGGAPSGLPARGRRVSERSAGRGVGAAGAADPAGAARRATARDQHAGGDECHLTFPRKVDTGLRGFCLC